MEARKGAMANIQADEQQPSTSAGAQAVNVPKRVPYVQYRRILQPVLELEGGHLTTNTMSDMFHAIEVAKQKMGALEFEFRNIEQPIMAIVHSKFDVVTKGIWEFQLSLGEPTLEGMGRFLEQRSHMVQEELGPPPQPVPMPGTPGARRKATS